MTTPTTPALPTTGENILEQGVFKLFERTEHSLTFVPACPEEDWLAEMRKLFNMYEGATHMRRRLLCYIADGLRFGEAAYGEKYSQAISDASAALALENKTVEKLVAMYQNLPPAARSIEVAETMFEVVAIRAIPELDRVRLLQEGKDEAMSVSAFKKHVTAECDTQGWKKRKAKKVNAVGEEPNKLIVDLNDPEGMRHAAEHVARFLDDESRFKWEQWQNYSLELWKPILKKVAMAARRLRAVSNGHKKK